MEDRANILNEMKICRFCLTSDEKELSNIYDFSNSEMKHSVPLPLQIMACIAIEVFEHDGMPQLICNQCRSQTAQAYIFKTNCKRADDALKVFLHTGQLSKPPMEPFDRPFTQHTAISVPQKQLKVVSRQMSSAKSSQGVNEPKSKRIKMEDGSEIITLDFIPDKDEGEVQEGENESECIFGLEDESNTQEDDDEEEQRESRGIIKVNPAKVLKYSAECFPCRHCDKAFPLQQLLDLHLATHDRERTFGCDMCNRKFFSKYDLNKHISTHSGDKPFNCSVCGKAFSKETLLRRHEKTHHDAPKYLCTQCDKTFLTSESLDSHMEKHKKKRPFTCTECNKSFVFKQGLERHLITHSINKPHKCNYCEASFNTAIKLARHITSHAGLRPYPCKICNRTFLLSHHLTRHMRSHYAAQGKTPEDAVGQHKCDICSMAFRRKDSLINHSAIHSMVNLRCVICNTAFGTAQMVKEHITTHLTDLPFPCDKCDYSFDTAEQLEEHELKHAEMEYEEQIEKEVMSEAQSDYAMKTSDNEMEEDYDEEYITPDMPSVSEYTITDMQNEDVANVATRSRSRDVEREQESNYGQILKYELVSDLDDSQQGDENQYAQEEMEEIQDLQPIKPIVRNENTKVYKRKSRADRKIAPKIQADDMGVTHPKQINQTDVFSTTVDEDGLPSEDFNALRQNKSVNMKVGEKVIKVQKFILTKDEMKRMAKEGILEMRGGQVVLKGHGQSILNATLKPVRKGDIESFISQKPRTQLKQYQGPTGPERSLVKSGPTRANFDLETEDIDLNSSDDVSQNVQ